MSVPICRRCGNCHVGFLIWAPEGILILLVSEVESAMTYEEDVIYEQSPMGIRERTSLPNGRDFRDFVFA